MRLLLQILAIILVVSTICICAVKPDMHKSVVVYNSDYILVPEEVKTVEKKEIPIMEIPAKPVETVTMKETKTIKTQTQSIPQQVKKVEEKQPVKKVETKKVEKAVATKPVVTQEVKKVEKPVTTNVSETTVKTITPQEEEIAWNVWRSNLQNKIMRDVRLPVLPAGIVFKFSFTVDKFGKVSNVRTWSETPSYNSYAIQYIAPVIKSYQGRDILNFPAGTARYSTDVTGGWRISVTEKFSTPYDYNDVEKVVK